MKLSSEEQLRKHYGWPAGRAAIKVLNKLEKHSIHFIKKSPFFILSTFDNMGKADASPRGGSPGFVHILNEKTLVIPDAKGNNRVDSLVNITETESAGCLFLIPGINETLRINGKAEIRIDQELLNLFAEQDNPPKTVILLHIQEMFLHCAKALMRSKLWDNDYQQSRPNFPTMGRMLNEQLNTNNPEETQDEMEKRYLPDL